MQCRRGKQSHRSAKGSAALEALMLVVFLIIPTWILLFNMGYAGKRLQDSQAASSLAGYAVIAKRTEGKAADASAIQNTVAGQVFAGETSPLALTLAESSDSDSSTFADSDLGVLGSLVSSLSGHNQVDITVERTSPFGTFANTPVVIKRTVGGSPYTYCELEEKKFNPLGGGGADFSMGIIATIAGFGDFVLAPFGGLPLGGNKCPD